MAAREHRISELNSGEPRMTSGGALCVTYPAKKQGVAIRGDPPLFVRITD